MSDDDEDDDDFGDWSSGHVGHGLGCFLAAIGVSIGFSIIILAFAYAKFYWGLGK